MCGFDGRVGRLLLGGVGSGLVFGLWIVVVGGGVGVVFDDDGCFWVVVIWDWSCCCWKRECWYW